MATLLPNGKQQFISGAGVPLAGGSVYFYIPNTTTPKNTYQDPLQVTQNTNPVVLDASGEAVIYGTGQYRQQVFDAIGNLIWDQLTQSTDQAGVYIGATSTGSANAQVLSTVSPAGFSLTPGYQISFIAGFTNTGAATLNAAGTGIKNIFKKTAAGAVALSGGELVLNTSAVVIYDGTQYELQNAGSVSSITAGAGLSGGTIIASGTIASIELTNAQTGVSYPVVTGDQAHLLTFSNALAMAVTLPQAGSTGFAAGWFADFSCLASSTGAATITPTTSTVDGQPTLVLTPGASVRVISDGTNYQIQRGIGRIAQIVNLETGAVATGTTTIPNDDTIPQITEGDQYLSLSITPTNILSTLYIDIMLEIASNATGVFTVALFQDATANALSAMQQDYVTAAAQANFAFRHKMAAGTTSATTFKVRAGNVAAGTTTFNGVSGARFMGGVMASSITIMEVCP